MILRMAARNRGQSGFTLLEVLLALTICAMALASLFSVIAGSKQLTFRARAALAESNALRNLVSLSLLVDETGDLLVAVDESDFSVRLDVDDLEDPERKTEATTEALYQYEVEDEDGNVVLRGTYWVSLELAE